MRHTTLRESLGWLPWFTRSPSSNRRALYNAVDDCAVVVLCYARGRASAAPPDDPAAGPTPPGGPWRRPRAAPTDTQAAKRPEGAHLAVRTAACTGLHRCVQSGALAARQPGSSFYKGLMVPGPVSSGRGWGCKGPSGGTAASRTRSRTEGQRIGTKLEGTLWATPGRATANDKWKDALLALLRCATTSTAKSRDWKGFCAEAVWVGHVVALPIIARLVDAS